MDLTQSLSTDSVGPGPTEPLLVTDVVYEVESTGHRYDTPIVHLRCRRRDGSLRVVEVEGFRPFFYITREDFFSDPMAVMNDRRVLGVELDVEPEAWTIHEEIGPHLPENPTTADVEWALETVGDARAFQADKPFESLYDEPLVRIICTEPGAVGGRGGLRDYFDETFEADIPFARRFTISADVTRGVSVPEGVRRVRYENWDGESDGPGRVQELTPCDAPNQQARICTVDIEVATHGGEFPEPHRAKNEITAIGAHDSYRDEYRLWGLTHPSWEADQDDLDEMCEEIVAGVDEEFGTDVAYDHVQLFDNETALMDSFHSWFLECSPDILTGWNSAWFDVPYLIQRSYAVNSLSIRDWTLIGKPATWPEERDGDTLTRFKLQGVCTLDMLDAYKKTQFRNLSSYKLDHVAEVELGHGKVDLAGDELDQAWEEDPITFFVYNVRDVEAVVEIERTCSLLPLYENLRSVTGADYETCNNNGPMIDTLFLRLASQQELALPTNTVPDIGDYHGAHVFNPVPGVHRKVVYPDLASLYPYLAWTLNLSPETVYDTVEEAEADGYSESDLFVAYVDRRDFAYVQKGSTLDHIDRSQYKGVMTVDGDLREMFAPRFDPIYYLKPSVKEGFIRSAIDLLVDLKYQYKGDKQMYGAVKRVTNSVYGVLGDSASGGRGFRLFDWRLAETITLAGQKVIQFTAEKYVTSISEIAESEGYDAGVYQVGGDTDSVQTAIPGAPDYQTALRWSQEASKKFVGTADEAGYYDVYMEENFNVQIGVDEHRMDVEIESLASALFFMRDEKADDPKTTGVKKRYAQHMVWDDGDGWLDTPDPDDGYENAPADPDDLSELKYASAVTYDTYESGVLGDEDPASNIGIKGFEYVRSDTAEVTKRAQLRVLTDILLTDDPRERVEPYLRELADSVLAGEVSLDDLARPTGISKALDDYGWKDVGDLDGDKVDADVQAQGGMYTATPGPGYRGAKYVDDHFPWESLGSGSKPKKIPIERVRSDDYPAVYDYVGYPKDRRRPDPPEVGREVDAIAVEHTNRIPEGFVIDYEMICEKELETKLEPILATVDLSWDELMADGAQSGLDDWF